jgi:AbrB family looped-hinge helix DNA binding protein
MSMIVQLGKQGTLVLPAQVREKYQMREGDTLQLVDLDGMLLLTRLSPVVPELARQIEQVRQEAG